MSPMEAFHALLCDLFHGDPGGLRRLLALDEGLRTVVASIPGEDTPLTKQVDAAVVLLNNRGLVPATLERLHARDDFSRKRPDINGVAALWVDTRPAKTPPPRDSNPSRGILPPRDPVKHKRDDAGDESDVGEEKGGAGSSRARTPWDARAELTRLLHKGPFFVAEAFFEAFFGGPHPTRQPHLVVAERVAGKIDELGAGIAAAEILVERSHQVLKMIEEGREADFCAAQRLVCALLSDWMPRRYDADGERVRQTHAPEGCDDLVVETDSTLVSEFHVAGADGRSAAMDGRNLRGKGSLCLPSAVGAEILGPEQLARQVAHDVAGENPARRRQYPDTPEGDLEFGRNFFKVARHGLRRRPRDLSGSESEWSALMSSEARAKLKQLFPDLRQVELRSPGPRESELVGILSDIFDKLDDAP